MHTLVFATHNPNKVEEVRSVLDNQFHIISLDEAGFKEEIPEPHDTLEANAREKSTRIYDSLGKDCFSEDTGLEVEALNGRPGVKSARYAGEPADSKKNIAKLLEALKGCKNREARFRTVFSLIIEGKEIQFEGICRGQITEQTSGEGGFGYDSVFIPEGATITFAEMNTQQKNQFSHRRKALDLLVKYLRAKE